MTGRSLAARDRYKKAKELIAGGMKIKEATQSVKMGANTYYQLQKEEGKRPKAAKQRAHKYIDLPQVSAKCAVIICTPDQLKSVIGGL